jgi:hypothetical protein
MRSTLERGRAVTIWSTFRQASRHLSRRGKPAPAAIASLMSMAAIAICATEQASAQLIYYYTGNVVYQNGCNNPNCTVGPNSPEGNITGIAIFNNIASGFTGTAGAQTVCLTGSGVGITNCGGSGISLFTFVNGQITQWNINTVTSRIASIDTVNEPPGQIEDAEQAYNIYSPNCGIACENFKEPGTWTSVSAAKNLGNPSKPTPQNQMPSSSANPPVPASNDGCLASNPPCWAGNPINAATGNKFQLESDFRGAPGTGLALTRYYNSQDTTKSPFGTGWHSTWHRSLNPHSPDDVSILCACRPVFV